MNEDDFIDDSGNESPDLEYETDASFEDEFGCEEDSDDDVDLIGSLNEEDLDPEDVSESGYDFKILKPDEIMEDMMKAVREVHEVTQIPMTTVRILLHYFQWNQDKVISRYFSENPEAMFAEAGVLVPVSDEVPFNPDPSSAGEETFCEVCYLSLPMADMICLIQCGHVFCKQCWTDYFCFKINDDGSSLAFKCQMPGCQVLVDDQTVISLIKGQTKVRYQQLVTNSFVQCNRLLKWCPSPTCTNAIQVLYVEAGLIRCSCSHTFCFACVERWHDPLNCDLLKKWLKKCADDSETAHWMTAHTKVCPKCETRIEKNGGCNHMTCLNRSCGHHFCWVCLGEWRDHDYYKCTHYKEDTDKDTKANQSKLVLERYLFHYERYANHEKSLKFNHELYATTEEKMEVMQSKGMYYNDVQYLKKAVDVLCETRRALMYTYAFAFSVTKNTQREIFEDNQRDLEEAIEQLTELCESKLDLDDQDITLATLVDLKQKIQNKYKYCDGRRTKLVKHIQEGYENNWWKYSI